MLAAAIKHVAINFVREDHNVRMGLQPFDKLVHFRFGCCTAGRIGRGTVDNNEARLRRDVLEDFVRTEGKLVRFLQMNGDGLCPAIVDDRFVDREARIGVHDFRAGFTKHHDGEEHRDLAARDDNDTVRVDLNAVAFVQVGNDGFPKL